MMESESTITEQEPTPLQNDSASVQTQPSSEATIIDSAANSQGGATDSTGNTAIATTNNEETSGPDAGSDPEKTLDFAAELTEKGTNALKEKDFAEAVDCFSRALEIRVSHYGELSHECVTAYYQYGRALLYKAQEEADPLATVPKKDNEGKQDSEKDGSGKNVVNGESSMASASSNAEEGGGSNHPERAADDASGGKGEEEDDEESDDEDLAEADEEESDLDLAWKMLDVARAISEKHPGDTMDKVDILSALAEVALEREDIETSLSDYQKALSILERVVEPDSRYLSELNFRICLCLEIGAKPQEAIPYCQKAISVFKARLQRLMNEVKVSTESATASSVSESDEGAQQLSSVQTDKYVTDIKAEIQILNDLSGEMEKKLEDLQQLALNPKSILSEILGMVSAKAKGTEKSAFPAVMSSSQMGTASSSGGFDSPTISTAHTNGAAGVTDLGVFGRGVKRVLMSTGSVESSRAKKPTPDPSSDKSDGKTS